jgi:hypothetical protein
MTTDVDAFLAERRSYSDGRLSAFTEALRREIPPREEQELIGDHTTIYAVGSGGRRELSPHSDLDVFLVKHGEPRRIDEVRLQSAVLRAMRAERFEDPSNDANFLKLHSAQTLIERLGEPRDDWENTFTARMLLLLESRPLLGVRAHEALAAKALDAYWKNVERHRADYLPIILLNDIIRYWRILLLNYESKTAEKQRRFERLLPSLPPDDRAVAERDLEADKQFRSYKLRFSRCLMCYSSVAYLLAEAWVTQQANKKAHVTREAVDRMVQLTPLERLEEAIEKARGADGVAEIGAKLKSHYVGFLRDSSRSKNDLLAIFADARERRPLFRAAWEFGEQMYEFVFALGRDNPLFRYLVV